MDHPSKAPTRRQFLATGTAGGLGLGLAGWWSPAARAWLAEGARSPDAKAQAVIHIFLPGGMAQQESFDPKPYSPLEYRGPLNAIDTALDGVQFSELYPRTAKIAGKITVCRSVTHSEAAHERGTHNMFTGYRPSPAVQYPSMGSVVSHELGARGAMPPYVCIPGQPNVYAGSGYLSSAYSPFSLGADPAQKDFKVRDLAVARGIDKQRFARRRKLLEAVDRSFSSRESADSLNAVDSFYESAYALIDSPEAQSAFDLNKEEDKLRDHYGRNAAGQRMLLARRLVEAGVRFVSLTYGGWDHHDKIDAGVRRQAPPLDQGYAALIDDLDQRGLLDTTLVLLTTEFGRTPKINGTEGRDHWPKVFSIVMAGGGIKRGFVYGSSDATAAEPENDPLTVENFSTTVYHLIGIDAGKELLAPGNRPIEIVKGGHVVQELLA